MMTTQQFEAEVARINATFNQARSVPGPWDATANRAYDDAINAFALLMIEPSDRLAALASHIAELRDMRRRIAGTR